MTREANFTDKMTKFSLWIRENCRDSKSGLSVSNIDFVIVDYKKKTVALMEEKTHMGDMHYGQRQIIKLLNDALSSYQGGWIYKGFYLIQFIGDGPEEGKPLFINGVEKSVQDLKDLIDDI